MTATTPAIYFDNNATTQVAPEVVAAMLPYFSEQFGNPSSLHQFGNRVGQAIQHARTQVQALLGAEHDSEIIFTSCGTESDTTAILSALKSSPAWGRLAPRESEVIAFIDSFLEWGRETALGPELGGGEGGQS